MLSSVFLKQNLFTVITKSHNILLMLGSSKTLNSFCKPHLMQRQLLQLINYTLVSSAVCTSLFLLPAYIICCSGLHPVVVWRGKKKEKGGAQLFQLLHLKIVCFFFKLKLKAEFGHFLNSEVTQFFTYFSIMFIFFSIIFAHTWHLKKLNQWSQHAPVFLLRSI